MPCPTGIIIARNTSISASVTSGEGGRSVVNSVQVVVVVSLSLHQEQCDNFRKIQHEKAKETGAVILYVALLFAPGPPSKGLYYTSVRARGPGLLPSGWFLDLLTWPTLEMSS